MATVKNRTITSVKTRKKRQNHPLVFEKLPKCPGSRIRDMTSYKVKCGKDLLLGYKSIKSAEETSMYPNDFVHVIKSKLENYNDPVVVKIYDNENEHLGIEIKILERINGYRNTAILICHFSCKDNKNNYFSKIIKPIRFCTNGSHSLHYFVYEYIVTGDISDFFTKNTDKPVIKSFVLQLIAVIIELAVVYRIYHGDINSGNIMVDTTEEKTLDYCIETETVTIETYGIMPKMIDYGRSHFYIDKTVSPNVVVWDIIDVLMIVNKYAQVANNISNLYEIEFANVMECYRYVRDVILVL